MVAHSIASTSMRPLAVIAGAGLVGRLLAWRLLNSGWQVALYEKSSASNSQSLAAIAGGMLCPCSEAVDGGEEVFTIGMASLKLWPQWLAALEQLSGQSIFSGFSGSLVIAHQQDSADWQRFHLQLKAGPKALQEQLEPLEQNALAKLEPELAGSFSHALWLRNEAFIAGEELLTALQHVIETQKGECHYDCIVDHVSCQGLELQGKTVAGDLAIDCRGYGARNALPELRGVRGEIMRVHAPEVNISRPVRLIHPRYSLYIVPRRNHHYVVGATEIESESTAPITVRSAFELLSALYTVHPGFAEATIVQTATGLRPAMPDNQPYLFHQAGLLQINGLYRHGFLLAPALIERSLDMIMKSAA